MIAIGHFGDCRRFAGLIELKWKNGIRVYAFRWGNAVIIALNGGNKNGQNRDIKKAKKIRQEILDGTRSLRK
jgi:putative addiction module killer protein